MNFNLVLRKLPPKVKPRQFAVFDLETHRIGDIAKPYSACFYEGPSSRTPPGGEYYDWQDYSYEGKCADKLMQHMFSPRYGGYWFYAHNGGRFDFEFILERFFSVPEHNKYTYEWIPGGGGVIAYIITLFEPGQHRKRRCKGNDCRGCQPRRVKHDGKMVYLEWTMVDSFNLMKMSLKKAGTIFQVTPKTDHGLTWEQLAQPEHVDVMRAYNRNDCKTLWEVVDAFQYRINKLGGNMQMTLPATAMDLFRRKYQKTDIYRNRHFKACEHFGKDPQKENDSCVSKCEDCKLYDLYMVEFCPRCEAKTERQGTCAHVFMRSAYHGGRTEIFRKEFQPYYKPDGTYVEHAQMVDINSHYANVMRNPMPVGPATELEGLTHEEVMENSKSDGTRIGIVDCEVTIPETCYLPPLPIYEKKLIFPVGRLRGVWSTAELRLLPLVGGRIVRSYRSLWFKTNTIFIFYVTRMFQYRDKDRPGWEPGMDRVGKDLMTNLYGKYAQREDRRKFIARPPSIVGLQPVSEKLGLYSEATFVSPHYIVPSLALHITALARAEWWRIAMDVITRGGRLYYGDTDSLVVAGVPMPLGNKLGELKLCYDVKYAWFDNPKHYKVQRVTSNEAKKKEADWDVKIKGVQGGFGGAQADYDGQPSLEDFDNFTFHGKGITREKLTMHLEAANAYIARELDFPRYIRVEKFKHSEYDKREVLADLDTRPIKRYMF